MTRPDAIAPLAERSNQLRQALERLSQLRDAGGTIAALQSQADAARTARDTAMSLASARALVRDLPIPTETLTEHRTRVQALRQRLESPVDGPLEVNLDFGQIQRDVAATMEALTRAWKQHCLSPVDGESLVPVLEKFAPFRAAVARYRTARAKLEAFSERLPKDGSVRDAVARQRNELHDAMKEIDAQGLDSDITDFLRRSVDGFPLVELIGNSKLIAWLEGQGLLPSLRVRPE